MVSDAAGDQICYHFEVQQFMTSSCIPLLWRLQHHFLLNPLIF
uniref:Uncharacterized protein n=1 Tax=Arundo donax TaxID=35708 RepID=A0A0A9E454_ARUDO